MKLLEEETWTNNEATMKIDNHKPIEELYKNNDKIIKIQRNMDRKRNNNENRQYRKEIYIPMEQ